MYGFAGRAFNFMGESGKIYNIISTLNIQVRPKQASYSAQLIEDELS